MHQRPFLSKVLLRNFDTVMAMSQSPSEALSSEMQLHKYEVIMTVSKSIIKQNAVAHIWSDYGRYPQQGNDQKEWLISSPLCFTDTICCNCKLVSMTYRCKRDWHLHCLCFAEAIYSDELTGVTDSSNKGNGGFIQRLPYFILVKRVYDERHELTEELKEQLDIVKNRYPFFSVFGGYSWLRESMGKLLANSDQVILKTSDPAYDDD